jgi:hypothetical protein
VRHLSMRNRKVQALLTGRILEPDLSEPAPLSGVQDITLKPAKPNDGPPMFV